MLIKINCVCHNDNLAWKSIQSSIIERGNADYCNIITSSHMNILSQLINIFTGSPSWNRQHHGQTIHSKEKFRVVIWA